MGAVRLALFGDVHGEYELLASSLELVAGNRFDLALLSGDVGLDPPWDRQIRHLRRDEHDRSVARVVQQVGQALDCPVALVPGNHDLPETVEGLAATNLDGQVQTLAGIRMAGLGGAGPRAFGFAYEWTEEQARARLQRLKQVELMLCHTPPAGTALDRTLRGQHVGSEAVSAWIAVNQPALFVCGHIHEAWGVEWSDRTLCVNAGAMGPPQGQALAWIVEWDGGPQSVVSHRLLANGDRERQAWL